MGRRESKKKAIYIDEKHGHLDILSKFPSIDKKALCFFLQAIKQETSVNACYDNYLRFSEIDSLASEQSIDEVANFLYEDYIGYKFHNAIQETDNINLEDSSSPMTKIYEDTTFIQRTPLETKNNTIPNNLICFSGESLRTTPNNLSYISGESCQDFINQARSMRNG